MMRQLLVKVWGWPPCLGKFDVIVQCTLGDVCAARRRFAARWGCQAPHFGHAVRAVLVSKMTSLPSIPTVG